MNEPRPVQILAYMSGSGRIPVFEWLSELEEAAFVDVVAVMQELEELGPGLGFPDSRHLREGILELRAKTDRHQLRVLYFFQRGAIAVLAAGFVKQSPQDLDREMKLALKRRREVEADPEGHTARVQFDQLLNIRQRRRKAK